MWTRGFYTAILRIIRRNQGARLEHIKGRMALEKMQSVNSLAHHPLLVQMRAGVWACTAVVPRAQEFNHEERPASGENTLLSSCEALTIANEWLGRRNVSMHDTNIGLLDLDARKIFSADFLGERAGRPVVGLITCSQRRNLREKDAMRCYARRLLTLLIEGYVIREPIVAAVWVFGAGRVEGELIERD